MRIRDVPLRIVRTRYKLLYFVAWFGVEFLLGRWVYPNLPAAVGLVGTPIVFLAFFIVAVRSFRGAHEAVVPSRPWWRLTGGVSSGFVLAVLWVLFAGIGVLEFLGVYPRESPSRAHDLADVANAIIWLVFAGLYAHSSIRLRRDPGAGASAPVTLAEPLKGLD